MSSYLSAELRRSIALRADHICEYCLIHEQDTFLGCQVDHIISQKHGGPADIENLAFACAPCNRAKGSDIGSISADGQFVRFYHPRADHWADHFALEEAIILPRTPIGQVTVSMLQLNHPERVIERMELLRAGRFPPSAAITRITRRT